MIYKKNMYYLLSGFFILFVQFLCIQQTKATKEFEEFEEYAAKQYIGHADKCKTHLNETTNSIVLTTEQRQNESPENQKLRHTIRPIAALAELLEDQFSVCVAVFYPTEENDKNIYISSNNRLGNVRHRLEIIKNFLNLEWKKGIDEKTSEQEVNYFNVYNKLKEYSIIEEEEEEPPIQVYEPSEEEVAKGRRLYRRLERLSSHLPQKAMEAIINNTIIYTDYSFNPDRHRYACHAEMNLIQYLIDEHKSLEGHLGISRLCCLGCTTGLYAILEKYSKFYTVGAHGLGFPNVRVPEFLFEEKGYLKHFLGQEAMESISKYCEENYKKKTQIRKMIKKHTTGIINKANLIKKKAQKEDSKNKEQRSQVSNPTPKSSGPQEPSEYSCNKEEEVIIVPQPKLSSDSETEGNSPPPPVHVGVVPINLIEQGK